MSSFKYLSRVLTALDDESPTVMGNLRKSWLKWDRFSGILGQEGENTQVLGIFFKVVV